MKFLQGIMILMLFLSIGSKISAQDYTTTLKYNKVDDRYEIYALPDADNSNVYIGAGSQITVLLPASLPDGPLNVTSIAGGPWDDRSRIYAPTSDPAHDFYGISSDALNGDLNAVSGQEILLFYIELGTPACIDGLRLFENNSDPQSSDPGMAGGDFNNFLADIGTNPFDFSNHWTGNYNNTGMYCNTPPELVYAVDTSFIENDTSLVIDIVTEDDNSSEQDSTLRYSLGGIDEADLIIDSLTGEITFANIPDFENPDDDDSDNVYNIDVIVCDAQMTCDTASVAITVTNDYNDDGIRLLCVDPISDKITIKNFGSDSIDISSHRLCSKFSYTTNLSGQNIISGSLNLAPGASVEIDGFSIDDAAADLGLYAPSGAFSDASVMMDFTQWGSAGNGRESVAVAKGIWTVGDYMMDGPEYCYNGNGNTENGLVFWDGNDAPIAIDDSEVVTQGLTAIIDIQDNDSDPEGDTLTTTIIGTSTQGVTPVVLNGDSISYTAPAVFIGNDSITYVICDSGTPELCDTALIVIVIRPSCSFEFALEEKTTGVYTVSVTSPENRGTSVNEKMISSVVSVKYPSTAGSITNFTLINSSTPYNQSGNFTPMGDPDNIINSWGYTSNFQDLTMTADVPVELFSFEFSDGCFSGQIELLSHSPAEVQDNGGGNRTVGLFQRVFGDGAGESLVCTDPSANELTKECNAPPLAIDDIATTQSGTPVDGNVLTNDEDPEGDELTVTTTPMNEMGGTVTIDSAGNFTFTPTPGYTGEGSFEYEVCDIGSPQQCDTAKVVIEIIDNTDPDNNPPTGVEDNIVMENDTTLTGDLLSNDSDPDGDNLTITITPVDDADNGTLTINTDGTFEYEPNSDFVGTEMFTYEVCDDGSPSACDTVTVTIEVFPSNGMNDIYATDDASTGEEGTDQIGNVADNDNDPEGDNLTVTEITGPTNGTLVVGTDGEYTYTPDPDFVGNDMFTYLVCDDGNPVACDSATVSITVLEAQEPPHVIPNPITVPQDSTGEVCMTISDLNEDDTFTATLCTGSPVDGTATPTVTGGELCVAYTPDNGFTGSDEICVVVCDNTGLCDTITIPVTIVEPLPPSVTPEPPVVIVTPIVVPESDSTEVCTVILDPNVSDTHTATLCSGSPEDGTAIANVVNGNLCIMYKPDADFTGEDEICVIVCDNTGLCDTISIRVTVVPELQPVDSTQPPVVVIPPVIVPEDSTIMVCGPIVDPNIDDIHTATSCGDPANGTVTISAANGELCIEYTPDDNFTGEDEICIVVCDGSSLCDTLIIPITVIDSNDSPEAEDDTVNTLQDEVVIIDVQDNDEDIDGDELTTTIIGTSTQGVTPVVEDGDSISYTPPSGYVGLDTITYEVCDSGTPQLCDTAMVVVNVGNVNDEPEIVDPPVTVIPEDTTTVTICMDINDPDTGESHTGSICDDPENGNATVAIVGGQVCVTYEPDDNFNGMDSICVKVCDAEGACDSVIVNITVEAVNDTPEAMDDTQNTLQDEVVTIDVQDNDSDIDGDELTTTIIGTSTEGVTPTVLNGDSISYTPPSGYVGLDTITYEVCDSGSPALCDTAMVVVNVGNVNDEPEIVDPPMTVIPEDTTTVTICMDINDPDTGESHTGSICDDPANGTATVAIVGGQVCVTYEPDDNFNGMDSICVKVCDGSGACDSVIVNITVTPVSDSVCVSLDVKVFLQGSLINDDGSNNYGSQMRTTINDLRLLPGQSVANGFSGQVDYNDGGLFFQKQPWLYLGSEEDDYDSNGDANLGDANYPSTVVDWVLVSVRSNKFDDNSSEVCQRPALLHKDGTVEIVGDDCCMVNKNESYYVVIEHPNHAIVMSDSLLPVENGTVTYDFTQQQSFLNTDPNFGTKVGDGQVEVVSGVWAMYAGNGDQKLNQNDTDINVDDEVIWVDVNGNISSYNEGDYNMNGDINFNDRIIWEKNNGKFITVIRDKNQ